MPNPPWLVKYIIALVSVDSKGLMAPASPLFSYRFISVHSKGLSLTVGAGLFSVPRQLTATRVDPLEALRHESAASVGGLGRLTRGGACIDICVPRIAFRGIGARVYLSGLNSYICLD